MGVKFQRAKFESEITNFQMNAANLASEVNSLSLDDLSEAWNSDQATKFSETFNSCKENYKNRMTIMQDKLLAKLNKVKVRWQNLDNVGKKK